MLRRAIEAMSHSTLPAGPDAFGDDEGDVHEADIDALAAIGVVTGTGPGTYSPNAGLRRDQMASLLSRVLDEM
jgi:hypothetical protein